MALSLEHFRRTYGAFVAVDDLSFTVASGEIVGLIGPNGAGKTTTLRSLAGILKPTSGVVRIDDFDIVKQPLEARRRLAFMPDEPHLFEYLTIREHLRMTGRLYGVTDVDTRARLLLDELELTGKEDAVPSELSRGMKQKLAIACGLLHGPRALLLDEPLTGLDPMGIRRMKATIAARAQRGAAVILSSHLLHLVEEICTRILVMNRGQAVALGTVAEIVASRPALSGRRLEDVFLALITPEGGARE